MGPLPSKKVNLSRVLTQLELVLQNTRKHWYKVSIYVNVIIQKSFILCRTKVMTMTIWMTTHCCPTGISVCLLFFFGKKKSCIQCMQCSNVLNLFHVNRKTLEWSFRLYFRVSKAGSITLKCFYYLECMMFSPTGYLFRPWISVAELNYVFSGHIQIAATQFKYGTLST